MFHVKHGSINQATKNKGEKTMKRWQFIIINGRSFELDTKNAGVNPNMIIRGIHDVYGRPSDTKISIFESWARWFIGNDGTVTVRSYNCMFFTLHGVVRDAETGNWYECDITPSHNYCWLIPNM